MKLNLLSIAALLTLFQGLAHADGSSVVTLNTQIPTAVVDVTDQKFDPIFGERPYETTCSRQVVDHTERRCHQVTGQSCSGGGESCSTTSDSVCNSRGCTSVPRRSCHSTPQSCHTTTRQSCGNENVYRTEHYSCTKTHTVQVGQRLVKTINHKVEVLLADPSLINDQGLGVSIDSHLDTVKAHLVTSHPSSVLTYAVTKISDDQGEQVQNISEKIVIDSGISGDIVRKMGLAKVSDLELGQNSFRFNLVNGAGLEKNLKLDIRLVRTPSIWFPKTIFDNSIESSSLSLVSEGSDLKAIVPYQALGLGGISGSRHSLSITLKLSAGNILNRDDFKAELAKELSLEIVKQNPTY